MSQHSLTIDPGGSGETVYTAGKISALDFNREHTAVGDFFAEVPYDLSLEDRIGDEVHIEDGSEFLFRGYLREVENERRSTGPGQSDTRQARLRGKGIGFDLTRDETERNPTNITVADEIANVWGLTSFSDTTTGPTANNTTSGEQVQEANTDAEFSAIASAIADDDPVEVQNGNIELLQTAFVSEGENNDEGPTFTATSSSYSDGTAVQHESNEESIVWTFTPEYRIPAENVAIQFRDEMVNSTTKDGLQWWFNGEQIDEIDGFSGTRSLGWRNVSDSGDYTGFFDGYNGADLNAGQTYELELRSLSGGETSNTADYHVDVVVVYDDRFNHDDAQTGNSFDNAVDSSNGHLNDPRLFPHQDEVELDVAATTWSVNSADLTTTWDDTTNNQRIQLHLSPDGSYAPSDGTEDNTASLSNVGFGSDVGTEIQGRARLSSYPESGTNAQSATPRFGYNGQKLQSWTLTIDGDDVPVITDEVYEGSHFEILQELHDEGRMNWTILHASGSKNVESYEIDTQSKSQPDWTVLGQTRSVSLRRGYANHVTVRGAKDDDGNRITQTVSDATEISTNGKEHIDVKAPQADTQTKVDRLARQILERRLTNAERRGRQEVVAINVDPGFSYPVDWSDNTSDTIPAELVHYEIQSGRLVGFIEFDLDPATLGPKLSGQDREIRGTQLAF